MPASSDINPRAVLQQLVKALPAEARHHITVIGSLAAGWSYSELFDNMQVRTKDIDCLLAPRNEAADVAVTLTKQLEADGWQHRRNQEQPTGSAQTAENALPAVRMHPPETSDWFVELLVEPSLAGPKGRQWLRVAIEPQRHYALPSFTFLAISNYKPHGGPQGIRIARPEMMALANALEHRVLTPDRMKEEIGERRLRRCAKDLGRVLSIAYMHELRSHKNDTGEDPFNEWVTEWHDAVKTLFPAEYQELSATWLNGINDLLKNEDALEEAHHSCAYGLLASQPPTLEQLRIQGQRLMKTFSRQVA